MGRNQTKGRIIRCAAAGAALLGLFLSSAGGMWRMPTRAPVGRLIRNLNKIVQEHPKDPQGHYVLGRVHSLAFTLKRQEINVWDRRKWKGVPEICSDDFQFIWGENPRPITERELLMHLGRSITHLGDALELDDKPSHYHLTLAHVLDSGAVLAEKCDVLPVPLARDTGEGDEAERAPIDQEEIDALIVQLGDKRASVREAAKKKLRGQLFAAAPTLFENRAGADEPGEVAPADDQDEPEAGDEDDPSVQQRTILVGELLSEYWRDLALLRYFDAFERSIDEDLQIGEQPMRGLGTLIGYESGQAYIRLMASRGVRNARERDRLARVEKAIKKLENKPRNGAITPIIFSIEDAKPIDDLLSSSTVAFDLNGDGVVEQWPWVKPDTAILVWDPKATGTITSGRQLFGSVTWWMFFEDGYHALDALDDDRNGWLEGHELAGIALWHDRNSDGVSDPGEVVPVRRTQVEAISVRGDSLVGQMPANFEGLRMRGDKVLPTYDWITSPADANPVERAGAESANAQGLEIASDAS
jgi:hypothetical protein